MDKKVVPDALLFKLKRQGYSDETIRELYRWYDSSEKKGVAIF